MSALERVHDANCGCTRCRGFQPGHALSTKHGSYAALHDLSPAVAAKFEELLSEQVAWHPADNGSIRLLAIVEVRIDRASAAIERADAAQAENALVAYAPGQAGLMLKELRTDLRAWINLSRKLRNDLAMSATSRGKLGLDVALARRAADQGLAEYVAERYGDGNGGAS